MNQDLDSSLKVQRLPALLLTIISQRYQENLLTGFLGRFFIFADFIAVLMIVMRIYGFR